MAPRKSHARKTKTLTDDWKRKIQTSMIINRLSDHINGKVELNGSQVTAALGLLKKTAPDLSSVAVGQDEDKGPIQITWGSK